jgi:phage baseplate assembly protein W
MSRDGDIYGRGIGFPPRVGADGRWAWSQAGQNIRESIRLILMTEPGERLMLPRFGAGLRHFLFEPNTVATHRQIQERITQALSRWEPRIRLTGVEVQADPNDPQAALATLRYELVASQATDQLSVRIDLGT